MLERVWGTVQVLERPKVNYGNNEMNMTEDQPIEGNTMEVRLEKVKNNHVDIEGVQIYQAH